MKGPDLEMGTRDTTECEWEELRLDVGYLQAHISRKPYRCHLKNSLTIAFISL